LSLSLKVAAVIARYGFERRATNDLNELLFVHFLGLIFYIFPNVILFTFCPVAVITWNKYRTTIFTCKNSRRQERANTHRSWLLIKKRKLQLYMLNYIVHVTN